MLFCISESKTWDCWLVYDLKNHIEYPFTDYKAAVAFVRALFNKKEVR